MDTIVITDPPRTDAEQAAQLGAFGVATVHEALGRIGSLGSEHRPVWPGARIGGNVVTALCSPGDNLMIHVAVEHCRAGDVLVVGLTAPNLGGLFGELFATQLQHRGVRGVLLDCGARDVSELREMGFPVWSRAINAQGSVKATPGAVNVPVVLGGQLISPGDVIVADDDGVLVVRRADVDRARELSRARVDKEARARAAFRSGVIGLDHYGWRDKVAELGIRYVTSAEVGR